MCIAATCASPFQALSAYHGAYTIPIRYGCAHRAVDRGPDTGGGPVRRLPEPSSRAEPSGGTPRTFPDPPTLTRPSIGQAPRTSILSPIPGRGPSGQAAPSADPRRPARPVRNSNPTHEDEPRRDPTRGLYSGGNLICGYASPPPSSAQIPLNSVNP